MSTGTTKPDKKRMPLPLQSTATLGSTVDEHIQRRLKDLGIVPSIPSPVRNETDTDHTIVIAEDHSLVLHMALENQKYYLEQAQKTGRPWFQCPRYSYQYSEHVLITVPMAEALMEYNHQNRDVDPMLVLSYARDINTGRWLQSGECIQIDLAGYMFDGQHRTLAIIKAGKSYILYITWNVPCAARMVVDSGKKRNVNAKIKFILGDTAGLGNRMSAVCRSMMMGANYRSIHFSEMEIFEFDRLYHDTLLRWLAKHVPGARSDVQAAVGKAYLWHGEEKMLAFTERLHKTVFPNEGDPIGALYRFLQRGKSLRQSPSPEVVYKKTVAAINHHLAGRTIDNLFADKNDIFEWDAGWKVPANAPALQPTP